MRKFALFPADQPSRSVMVRMIRYQKLLKLFRVCCLIYLPICWRKTILHSKCKKFAQKNEMGKELHNIYETYPQRCLSQLGVSHCSCIKDLIRCIVHCVSSIFQYAELVQRGASETKTVISNKLINNWQKCKHKVSGGIWFEIFLSKYSQNGQECTKGRTFPPFISSAVHGLQCSKNGTKSLYK